MPQVACHSRWCETYTARAAKKGAPPTTKPVGVLTTDRLRFALSVALCGNLQGQAPQGLATDRFNGFPRLARRFSNAQVSGRFRHTTLMAAHPNCEQGRIATATMQCVT